MDSEIITIAMCTLFVLVVLPSAAARQFSPSPIAAPTATATTDTTSDGQGALLHWLQITAVPLGVSLIGACIWGVTKRSVPWRCLTGQREGRSSNATDQGDELREGNELPPAQELPIIDPGRDGSDLEEEKASSHRSEDNEPAEPV